MKQLKLLYLLVLSMLILSSCSDDDDVLSTENSITEFTINSVNGTINETDKTISLTLPYGTNPATLKPVLKISPKASVTPNSGVETDFSNPVKYIVKAESGAVKEYVVTVSIAKNNDSKILSFAVSGVNGIIDEYQKTIVITLPKHTNITALKPTIALAPKASINPGSETPQNFSNPVKYTVTAEDGSKTEYTVTVSLAKSTEAKITSFIFESLSPKITANINETTKTITAEVPYGTNISSLSPTIKISEDATISPNTPQNFTNPVKYTVTAEDGTKIEYTVQVTVSPFETLISDVSSLHLLLGDSFTITGKFAKTNNTVVLKLGNQKTNVTIISENETTIVAKIPTDIRIPENRNRYNLVVTSNQVSDEYIEYVLLYPADKPAIFYSNKEVYERGVDNIIVTGKNFTAKTAAVPYLLFHTDANVTTNNLKMAIDINAEGTTATRLSIGALDTVEYEMSIFIDGVESNKIKIQIK